MKTVAETMKETDQKKRQLQEEVDQLNEDCAKLNAKGQSLCSWCVVSSCDNSIPMACQR